jgi:hypothetical protein
MRLSLYAPAMSERTWPRDVTISLVPDAGAMDWAVAAADPENPAIVEAIQTKFHNDIEEIVYFGLCNDLQVDVEKVHDLEEALTEARAAGFGHFLVAPAHYGELVSRGKSGGGLFWCRELGLGESAERKNARLVAYKLSGARIYVSTLSRDQHLFLAKIGRLLMEPDLIRYYDFPRS